MREVRKTFSTSLIGKKESTATLSLYLRAVKDDSSSETLSKVADEMRTKLPQRINSVFSSRVSPVEMKKNQSKAVVIGTQE
jgi:hypothetical protein